MSGRYWLACLFGLAGALSGFPVFSQVEGPAASDYFVNRSYAELAALDRGETLVGAIADWRKMSLGAAGGSADILRRKVSELRPNYITEFLAVAPAGGGELERLKAALGGVEGYTSIVYLSKRYNMNFPLFDKMVVRSRMAVPGGEAIESSQHMLPFEDFDARYEYALVGDELRFTSENTGTLRYSGFPAVAKGDMVWSILARRAGARVYVYGVGAMRAFDAFGAARPRMEVSFIGRVESFMRYMFGKMK